jgi:hypothetical protein
MSKEVDDLVKILEAIDSFMKEFSYNPFDNYAWREVLTFDYLKTYYPTIKKLPGRYGADGCCSELNLTYIEQKSTKAKKRKTSLDFNVIGSKYQIDMSKPLEKTFKADAFIFSLFDSDDSTYPIHIVFVHEPANVQKVKDLILEKQKSFDTRVVEEKTHAHIDLNYDELRPLGQIFDNRMSKTNIMEFFYD